MYNDWQFTEPGQNIIPSDHRSDADAVFRVEQFVAETHEQLRCLREKIKQLERKMAQQDMMNKISAGIWLVVGLFWLFIFLL